MLGWILERTKMASIAGKWADATSLDPGDNGQTAVMASALMKATGMRAEDAWLASLMKWMTDHPDPESSKQIARAMIRFLDVYEFSVGLAPETRQAARLVAEGVLEGYLVASPPARPVVTERSKPPAPVSAPDPVITMTAITQLPDSDFLPSGALSKDYAYKRAMIILLKRLKEDGYTLEWIGNSRVDTPSVIAAKAGISFFVLLDASVYPMTPNPAPFMIQRCADRAKAENGYVRLARITLFNAEAKNDIEKRDISWGDLGFTFVGLETS